MVNLKQNLWTILSSTYLYGNYLNFFNLTKIISTYVIFSFTVPVKILKARNQSTYMQCLKKDMLNKVLEGIIKYDIAKGF